MLSRVFSSRLVASTRFFSNQESFLNGSNSNYMDEMYLVWRKDPSLVHASWDAFFKTGAFEAAPAPGEKYQPKTSFVPELKAPPVISINVPRDGDTTKIAEAALAHDAKWVHDTIKVVNMVRAFQVRGHFLAKLDPLKIHKDGVALKVIENPVELEYESWGFTEADLNREFNIAQPGLDGLFHVGRGPYKLAVLIERLKQIYESNIGLEYMHIPSRLLCNWIRNKFETPSPVLFNAEEKKRILNRLTWSDHFERFCAQKYNTAKRFGLEGCESLIPGLKAMIDCAADAGVQNIVLGMPHRGRLNVLYTICKKPLEQILHEFAGVAHAENSEGSGDVKYHLGYSSTFHAGATNKQIHMSLVANPSHLETVVCGKVRAKQFYGEDDKRSKTVPILMHGDAAFSGQGVVYETMALSDLPDYTSGGTVHVVVNNQIGFTTDPALSRSTSYCSDVAKAFNAPIFHVNGDSPEDVARVCEAAMQFRNQFNRDVVIDLIGYRKNGHNEVDEPLFTQPKMYSVIKAKESTYDLYCKQLLKEGVVSQDYIDTLSKKVKASLEQKFQESKTFSYPSPDWMSSHWAGLSGSQIMSKLRDTGVKKDKLVALSSKINTLPADFHPHRVVKAVYENRLKNVANNANLDWATGEALAFATLLDEGVHVRLSGQDVERGTFSHRHAVVHDQVNYGTYTPLSKVSTPRMFSVSNSNLSEYAVMGFEYGFSTENPYSLVLWEAQFGDFVNGAQIMIDQYISSAEAKWLRQSGLVLLLPHGFEGAGPEHSSCRLERFLQASDDHPDVLPDMHDDRRMQIQQTNWQVCNVTTPANYFHLLRRQIHRSFRKPLVVATPKSLLRHKLAVSKTDDLIEGTSFQRVLPETASLERVTRLVFCSGKVYYDLLAHREANNLKHVALCRVEQISPFPFDLVAKEYARYPHAEVVWVQEEPMNMGAWTYVSPRIFTAIKRRPRYVGRKPAASPATGWHELHDEQLKEFVMETFEVIKPL